MTCTGEPRQMKTIAFFTSLDREFSGTAAWALANCMSAVGLLQNDFPVLGKRIKWLILPLHESETDRHLIGLSG